MRKFAHEWNEETRILKRASLRWRNLKSSAPQEIRFRWVEPDSSSSSSSPFSGMNGQCPLRRFDFTDRIYMACAHFSFVTEYPHLISSVISIARLRFSPAISVRDQPGAYFHVVECHHHCYGDELFCGSSAGDLRKIARKPVVITQDTGNGVDAPLLSNWYWSAFASFLSGTARYSIYSRGFDYKGEIFEFFFFCSVKQFQFRLGLDFSAFFYEGIV